MGRDRLTQLEERFAQLEDENSLLNRTNPAIALGTDLHNLGNVPYAKMHQSSTQTITNGTWTTITMDILDIDTIGDGVDLANEQLIIRRSGIYLVMGTVIFAANDTGGRFVGISINSAATPNYIFAGFVPAGGTAVGVGPAVAPIPLKVGDTLELMGWHGRGTDLDTSVLSATDTSWLSALLVAND